MTDFIVYKITCTESRKCYIGITTQGVEKQNYKSAAAKRWADPEYRAMMCEANKKGAEKRRRKESFFISHDGGLVQ